MPLRVAIRKDTGTLWITGTVTPAGAKEGYRVRQRAGSDSEAAAREEAAALELQILRDHHLGAKPLERGFAAAVTLYLETEQRSADTEATAGKLLRHFGNIALSKIDQDAVDAARKVIVPADAAPGTVNRNLITPLRAILNCAAFRGWCPPPRFKTLREPQGRTEFLLPAQFEAVYAETLSRVRPLLRFLICAGCRLGEALSLDWSQVDLRAARVRLWADQTKGRAERMVELPPAAVVDLAGLPGRAGRVFRSRLRGPDGELLPYAGSATIVGAARSTPGWRRLATGGRGAGCDCPRFSA